MPMRQPRSMPLRCGTTTSVTGSASSSWPPLTAQSNTHALGRTPGRPWSTSLPTSQYGDCPCRGFPTTLPTLRVPKESTSSPLRMTIDVPVIGRAEQRPDVIRQSRGSTMTAAASGAGGAPQTKSSCRRWNDQLVQLARRHAEIGDIPPAELEAAHYDALAQQHSMVTNFSIEPGAVQATPAPARRGTETVRPHTDAVAAELGDWESFRGAFGRGLPRTPKDVYGRPVYRVAPHGRQKI